MIAMARLQTIGMVGSAKSTCSLGTCGIIPCGQPIEAAGTLTCNNPTHKAYYQRWLSRFGRLSYQGVKRVVRHQRAAEGEPLNGHPELHPQLPAIGNTPGDEVVQTF